MKPSLSQFLTRSHRFAMKPSQCQGFYTRPSPSSLSRPLGSPSLSLSLVITPGTQSSSAAVLRLGISLSLSPPVCLSLQNVVVVG
ncbi:hypothetical protein RHGRI_025770 [Rhododendron griersonianum]|uniref:Uncharacterized protein n=1 Tax=Rhododendron griersonianum TaxID=479676 RepID=A0AAV6ITX0_9ERIC|nr:hypothetical protein RHGRI_025770 [Rhododendron griersonianum]